MLVLRRFQTLRLAVLILTVVLAVSIPTTAGTPQYTFRGLGFLPGATSSAAYGINEAGQIAGYSATPAGGRTFFWDPVTGMRDIGTLAGGYTGPGGINSSGQIAGLSKVNNVNRAFLWDPDTGMRDLGVIDRNAFAMGVNDLSQVVGQSGYYGFLWDEASGMRAVPSLGGATVANDISNSGQVVGFSGVLSVGYSHAFLWQEGEGIRDLGSFGGFSSAEDINNVGQAVGYCSPPEGYRAFIWDSVGGMRDPGFLPGRTWAQARAINDSGYAVGDSGNRAFIWDPVNGMRDLNTLIDAPTPGWVLTTATAINSRGQIVGYGQNSFYQVEAFVLTPVPEPGSLMSLALLSGLSLAFCGRRRPR